MRFIANFKFTEDEIKFLRSVMPTCEVSLLVLLKKLDHVMEILHDVQLKYICSFISSSTMLISYYNGLLATN
jgi:hypothetical protein